MQVDQYGASVAPNKDISMGGAAVARQDEGKLSAYEIYHVELTGMCTDND